MDLSKAFDTINHELLIAKLDAYGFGDSALRIVLSYISDRDTFFNVYHFSNFLGFDNWPKFSESIFHPIFCS